MRSASKDLTARARIRDAAIRAFARDGFDATSLRSIASDADVSAALIVHHFGDKNALRAACDDYVVSVFLDDKHHVIDAPTAGRIRAALHNVDRYGPYIDYLARMLTDRTPAADRLFDEVIEMSRRMLDEQRELGLLVEVSDPEMTTLLVTLIGLAPVLMRSQVARVLGADQLSPAGLQRITLPTLELLTHGIYADPTLLDGARQAIADEQAGRPVQNPEAVQNPEGDAS
jgi:AcrR family transcriptional regulator